MNAWPLVFAGTAALFLPGCGSDAPGGKAEIRYLAWGNPEQTALEQKYCDEFNLRNPDVHVSLMLVPGSAYKQKMILMLASRTAPDVIRVDHYDFPSLVGKDYFYDENALAAADPGFHRSDFFPMTIREGTYKGGLYGLNMMFGGQIMYYNRKMVREAGLEDPYQLAQRGKWTYEKLRQYAVAMTKRDSHDRPLQFGVQIPGFPGYVPFLWGYGAHVMNAEQTRCTLDSPQAAAGLQYLADLRWKDRCSPSPAQSADSAFKFESGRIGMVFDWSGMSVRYRKAIKDFDWDICPMPVGPQGFSTIVKGNQLVVYRESAHPEAAWRFTRFLTSEPVEEELYGRLRRNCPTRKSVAYSAVFLDDRLEPHHTKVFVQGIEQGRELPITDRWPEWTAAYNAEMDDLFSGRNLNAAEVVAKATKAANEVLAGEAGF